MHLMLGAFPDAHALLSLDPEQLAGFFLFPFRNLPWRDDRAVRRCIAHWTEIYPPGSRGRVADALMAAWSRLKADGLLGEPPLPLAERPRAELRSLRIPA